MKKINKLSKRAINEKLLNKYRVTIDELDPIKIKQFKEKCKSLTDHRIKKKCSYKIWDVVVVVFLATLARCDDWEEIYYFASSKYKWLKSFLQLTGGIPSAKSYERIISVLNPVELENMCVLFAKDVLLIFDAKRDILSFDGKTDNSSSRNENEIRKNIKALNVLNVYSHNYKMCIASEMIDDKTNEITAIPSLISRINIKESIVTWDALNTQKNNIKAVISGKGDYVVALKANHESFYEDIKLYFDDNTLDIIRAKEYGYLTYKEKSHSSIITYEYFQTEDVSWYYDYKSWRGLKSFGVVVKSTTKNNKTSVEKRYYISSLYTNIILFSDSIRTHWQIENNLHWHLDYTFSQDTNTTVNKNALYNLQIIKKFSLSLLNDSKVIYNCSLKNIRLRLALDFENEILRFFNILAR